MVDEFEFEHMTRRLLKIQCDATCPTCCFLHQSQHHHNWGTNADAVLTHANNLSSPCHRQHSPASGLVAACMLTHLPAHGLGLASLPPWCLMPVLMCGQTAGGALLPLVLEARSLS